MSLNEEATRILKGLTGKKEVVFMDKCRDSAELLMVLAKRLGFEYLVIQEEGGWYTYEKSGVRRGLKVLKAPMNDGVLVKEGFPFDKKALVLLNTNPGYAFVDDLCFYDDMKRNGSLVVNDVVSSIGEEYAKKGDFVIGSFGKHKPLSISSGGSFIAFDDDCGLLDLKQEIFIDSGKRIAFDELVVALKNLENKKRAWIDYSNKTKKELLEQGFDVINENESINVLVRGKKENLIKFCVERNLEFLDCPLYIRTLQEAVSIEIKKKSVEDL